MQRYRSRAPVSVLSLRPPEKMNWRDGRLIGSQTQRFGPCLMGSVAFGPVLRQSIMVGVLKLPTPQWPGSRGGLLWWQSPYSAHSAMNQSVDHLSDRPSAYNHLLEVPLWTLLLWEKAFKPWALWGHFRPKLYRHSPVWAPEAHLLSLLFLILILWMFQLVGVLLLCSFASSCLKAVSSFLGDNPNLFLKTTLSLKLNIQWTKQCMCNVSPLYV